MDRIQHPPGAVFGRYTAFQKRIHPVVQRAIAAQRIEDSAMWGRYAKKMQEIQQQRTTKTKIIVKTTAHLSRQSRDTLNPAVNEVYLFHGTSIACAAGIAETGFRIDLAGFPIRWDSGALPLRSVAIGSPRWVSPRSPR